MGDVRFIRKNGHVIPIRSKSGAPAKSKKKYPAVKPLSNGSAALSGAAAAYGAHKLGFKAFGVGAAAAIGFITAKSITVTKKAKGESSKHAAQRVANASSSALPKPSKKKSMR